MTKFPKRIYVVEHTDDEEPWFELSVDATDLAKIGEQVDVGEYELVRRGHVTAEPVFVPSSSKKSANEGKAD